MAKLYVVGIGPGSFDEMTLRAAKALEACELIVGYGVYVDLVQPHFPDKAYHASPMTKEVARCQYALDQARLGRETALICSGDAGIYGLAGLALELRGEDSSPEIEVVAGLTAASAGAALLGAPLTHDFAVISLSDLLTPWEQIEGRLKAAGQADFSVVLYNPGSKKRREHLRRACDLLLASKSPDTVCGIVRNIARTEQDMEILSLKALRDTEVDMFTTVFIGNSQTKCLNRRMVTPRGYRDV